MPSTTSGRVFTRISLQPSSTGPPKSAAVSCRCCSMVPMAPSITRMRLSSASSRASRRSSLVVMAQEGVSYDSNSYDKKNRIPTGGRYGCPAPLERPTGPVEGPPEAVRGALVLQQDEPRRPGSRRGAHRPPGYRSDRLQGVAHRAEVRVGSGHDARRRHHRRCFNRKENHDRLVREMEENIARAAAAKVPNVIT